MLAAQLQAEKERNAPKVAFVDHYVEVGTSKSFRETAKILKCLSVHWSIAWWKINICIVNRACFCLINRHTPKIFLRLKQAPLNTVTITLRHV